MRSIGAAIEAADVVGVGETPDQEATINIGFVNGEEAYFASHISYYNETAKLQFNTEGQLDTLAYKDRNGGETLLDLKIRDSNSPIAMLINVVCKIINRKL